MTAQAGRDILFKLETAPGSGVFTTIGAFRNKSVKPMNPSTDVSDSASPGAWRELKVGFGLKALSVSGGGIYKSAASEKQLKLAVRNGQTPNFQIIMPDNVLYQGPFAVEIEWSGNHDGEVAFSATFESAGEITETDL